MKVIIHIETNFTGIDAIVKSAKLGYKNYLVTSDFNLLKSLLPIELFEGFESAVEILRVKNSNDVDEVCEAIAKIRPDAVLTFSQFRLITTSKVAARLGLAHTNTDALETAINKFALREKMRELGLPFIKFCLLGPNTTAEQVVRDVGLPLIIKPASGHSSLSIKLCRSVYDLQKFILENKDSEKPYIIEEYLEGPLFSLETITTGPGQHVVWGYTDRELNSDFVETRATFPSKTPDDRAGIDLVLSTLSLIKFDLGSCHSEIIFTANGPRIVEINPRAAGSGVCRLIETATGRNTEMEVVDLFCGKISQAKSNNSGCATMKSVLPHASGRIQSLPNRHDILSLPGVLDVWFQRKVNDNTDGSRSNFSFIVTVLAVAADGRSSVENAERAAEYATTRIQIDEAFNLQNQIVG